MAGPEHRRPTILRRVGSVHGEASERNGFKKFLENFRTRRLGTKKAHILYCKTIRMKRQVSSHGGVPTSGLDRQEEGESLEGWPQGGVGRSASFHCSFQRMYAYRQIDLPVIAYLAFCFSMVCRVLRPLSGVPRRAPLLP